MEFTKENSSEATFLEIKRLIKEFQDKFSVKTTNTEGFLTINELETLWSELRNSTDVLYSDMINHLMSTIDEKELVSKKKENSTRKE
jgi:Ca2+-binding EF-hand superfamily protein